MAEFKDAALWMKLAFLMTMLGVVSLLFGFAIGISEENNKIKGAMIAGFLCFMIATVLILCLVFLDEVNGSKLALICFVIFALIAGIAVVAGYALWGTNKNIGTFSPTVGIPGAVLAILGGIFGILELVGVTPVAPSK